MIKPRLEESRSILFTVMSVEMPGSVPLNDQLLLLESRFLMPVFDEIGPHVVSDQAQPFGPDPLHPFRQTHCTNHVHEPEFVLLSVFIMRHGRAPAIRKQQLRGEFQCLFGRRGIERNNGVSSLRESG